MDEIAYLVASGRPGFQTLVSPPHKAVELPIKSPAGRRQIVDRIVASKRRIEGPFGVGA